MATPRVRWRTGWLGLMEIEPNQTHSVMPGSFRHPPARMTEGIERAGRWAPEQARGDGALEAGVPPPYRPIIARMRFASTSSANGLVIMSMPSSRKSPRTAAFSA